MTDYKIRQAGPADAAMVRTMVVELADHQDEGRFVTSTEDDWRTALGRDDVIVLVAEGNDSPAGYVSALRRAHLWTGRDILALDDLYVREAHRDAGLGRTLMLELARLASPDNLTITWGLRLENEAGARFYNRLGATLRTKTLAAWSPDNYNPLLD
ncbi:ribosomal protein S18 acetylase RimI-like enzyme [Kribbella amoyensis]|uniref:Ribosomal protein S18 acetylase RimI-like enzyme n=1 Tax=Kribbella amoyensis TaxID=996641 RepID=A0A561B7H7_9ACTN|nr:GNAT family N-acetyltransferase [Kribbella amoyensis]TWD74783.1 ribosomal protein S18 acetylase RimI-like enzyme [Kribbella amoyensis]